MSTARMTSKGQITIPKAVRDKLHLKTGDEVAFVLGENGEVRLRPRNKSVKDVCGMLSKYKRKRPVTVEEMNDAIAREMRSRRGRT